MKVFSTSAAAGPRATTGPNEGRYDTVQTRTSKLRFEFNVTGEVQAKKPIIGRVHMISLLSKMQRDETIVSVLPIKIDDTTNPAVDNLTSLPQDDNIYKYFDIKSETVKQGNRDNLIVECRLLCSKTIPQLKFDSGPLYDYLRRPGHEIFIKGISATGKAKKHIGSLVNSAYKVAHRIGIANELGLRFGLFDCRGMKSTDYPVLIQKGVVASPSGATAYGLKILVDEDVASKWDEKLMQLDPSPGVADIHANPLTHGLLYVPARPTTNCPAAFIDCAIKEQNEMNKHTETITLEGIADIDYLFHPVVNGTTDRETITSLRQIIFDMRDTDTQERLFQNVHGTAYAGRYLIQYSTLREATIKANTGNLPEKLLAIVPEDVRDEVYIDPESNSDGDTVMDSPEITAYRSRLSRFCQVPANPQTDSQVGPRISTRRNFQPPAERLRDGSVGYNYNFGYNTPPTGTSRQSYSNAARFNNPPPVMTDMTTAGETATTRQTEMMESVATATKRQDDLDTLLETMRKDGDEVSKLTTDLKSSSDKFHTFMQAQVTENQKFASGFATMKETIERNQAATQTSLKEMQNNMNEMKETLMLVLEKLDGAPPSPVRKISKKDDHKGMEVVDDEL